MFVLQVRSHSSVSFVRGASPTAATARNTLRSTRHPSPTTAKPWAALSPTPTQALCASIWRSTSSHHLPPTPRTRTTPSPINSNNLTRPSSSPSIWRLTASLLRLPTKMLIYLCCPTTVWTLAQRGRRNTSSCCGVPPPWPCLWICLCRAWGVSFIRNSRVAEAAHGRASALSTQPYLSCLTSRSGTSVPGLQHQTFLCFTPTTSNQNLVTMRSTWRRMDGLDDIGHGRTTCCVLLTRFGPEDVLWNHCCCNFLRTSTCTESVALPRWTGCGGIRGGFDPCLQYKTQTAHHCVWTKRRSGFPNFQDGIEEFYDFTESFLIRVSCLTWI